MQPVVVFASHNRGRGDLLTEGRPHLGSGLIDDAAHNPAVIDPRHAVGLGKEGRDPSHLPFAQQEPITHASLLNGDCESQIKAD